MKTKGFTLAEVLITLVIIGVIAAMTVPSLMNNTKGQEYRAALKKAVSAINQSLTLHYALDGQTADDLKSDNNLAAALMSHMNVLDSTAYSLPSEGIDGYTSGTKGTDCFATADGIVYCVSMNGDSCDEAQETVCGHVYVDVNGARKPNAATTSANSPKDQYMLEIYNQKIVPGDTITQAVMYNQEGAAAGTATGAGTT